VVRNEAYRRGSLNVRERHNERKNENYFNADIVSERAELNIYFKKCDRTYEQTFDKLLADGVISTRGLKPDAHIVDEFIFDVNTEYFELRGGYEYAKKFYEEAYRLAVKEIDDDKYILSAVMHADERNDSVSEQLGHDVYHYHLHVVYIPIVEKEVYFKKNNKNPELAGKLKEVIHQVSHSKKWPREVQLDEHGEPVRSKTGKAVLINSYSLLQDRFFGHMRAAGYDGFERGERGSTAQHLSDLEYKTKMESERAAEISAAVEAKENSLVVLDDEIKNKGNKIDVLDSKIEKNKKQITSYQEAISHIREANTTYAELESMAKPTLFGKKVELSVDDWNTAKNLAKEAIISRGVISRLKDKLRSALNDCRIWRNRYNDSEAEKEKSGFKKFIEAFRIAPVRLIATIADIMLKPPERTEAERVQQKQRDYSISR